MARRSKVGGNEPLKVGLYGGFGTGNWGNDETARTLAGQLRERLPYVEPFLISYGAPSTQYRPEFARVVWMSAPRSASSTRLGRVLARGSGAARDLWRHVQVVRSADVIIVAGGGLFENDATAATAGMGGFLNLVGVGASARMRGVPFGIVAVGATRWQETPERLLVGWVMRLAQYRSFRDVPSRDALVLDGGAKPSDQVFADLVFAEPLNRSEGPRRCVGIGVMAHGWLSDGDAGAAYVDACASLAKTLMRSGTDVLVFGGDASDERWAATIVDRAANSGEPLPGHLERVDASAPGALDDAIDRSDVIVCSRYHNVVMAVRHLTPVVAVADREKTRTLMADIGQSSFVVEARQVDADLLEGLVTELMKSRASVVEVISNALTAMSRAAEAQVRDVCAHLVQQSGDTAGGVRK